ncbi:S26 family signal peptidase [Haloplanus ruber]|uniref:S26 family signal peptidase n=1 Tax=Haloplanus ruber TaxID=869892 RepID=A0ABD6CVW0_9EURY|nr:S26 family signal peptidase [Haloplanus ruber]
MSADDGPRPPDRETDHDSEQRRGPGGTLDRLSRNDGLRLVVRETALSVGAVVAIGLLLFALSGVWPPMVAVESGSMEPHMHKGDLVFITDTGRFTPDAAHEGSGVVPRSAGREVGYWKFGAHGSVIVYDEPGGAGPPVIHRAQFWVDEGENWYDRANPDYVVGDNCVETPNCPAPHAGFVTKGDANRRYDQVNGISRSGPVKPSWIVGTARVRIPYLGWVRLGVSGTVLGTTPGAAADPTAVTRAPTPEGPGTGQAARSTQASAPTPPKIRKPAPTVTPTRVGRSSVATQ